MDGSGAGRAEGRRTAVTDHNGADAARTVRGQGDRRSLRARRRSWIVAAAGLLVAAVVGTGVTPAGAQTAEQGRAVPSRTVTWTGNGVEDDGAAPSLDHEVCGIDNGAPVDGTYLQWVLVAKDVSSAALTIGTDAPVTMTRQGRKGTFQYVQTGVGTLQGVIDGGVTASYVGKADPKAKVVLGSGCLDVTLTVVSPVPFAVISVGLTEAECLSVPATATLVVQFIPAATPDPSLCVAAHETIPASTVTVVMPVNPTFSVTVPSATFNAGVIKFTGTFGPNPACTVVGAYDYCLVTAGTTVTIEAPPPV